jgi:hypothetical protein
VTGRVDRRSNDAASGSACGLKRMYAFPQGTPFAQRAGVHNRTELSGWSRRLACGRAKRYSRMLVLSAHVEARARWNVPEAGETNVCTEWRQGSIPDDPETQAASAPANSSANGSCAEEDGRGTSGAVDRGDAHAVTDTASRAASLAMLDEGVYAYRRLRRPGQSPLCVDDTLPGSRARQS